MRYNTLRKKLKTYIEYNKGKYLLLLTALVMGITGGVLFSCAITGEEKEVLLKSIEYTFGNLNEKNIFTGFVVKNLKLIPIMLVGTLSVYTMPVLILNILFYVFSLSFTLCFCALGLGFKGMLTAAAALSPQILFELPVILLLTAVGIDYTLHNIKQKKHIRKANRKKLYTIYCAGLLFLTLLSLIDVFVIPKIVNAISACF